MKRIYKYMVMAACVMMMVGCQKDLEGVLTAVIENYQNEEGKVYVDDARYAYWHEGDKVMVNGSEGTITLIGIGTTIAGVGFVDGTEYNAVYPKLSYITGSSTSVMFPQTQVYREQESQLRLTKQVIDAPMVAHSNGSVLNFRNVGALMKVTFQNPEAEYTGDITVKYIELVGGDDVQLWGTASYEWVNNDPQISDVAEGGNVVRLMIPEDENHYGVIASGQLKSFYIAVPTTTTTMQVKVAYNKNSNNVRKLYTSKVSSSKSIVRNTIGTMNMTNAENVMQSLVVGGYLGTEDDPYLIYDEIGLTEIQTMCTDGTTAGKYFKQMGDITIANPANYAGIGTEANPFMGNYDGNGKMITLGSSTGAKSKHSLFEYISTGANISNLIVEAYISLSDVGAARGGLVGTIKSGSQNVIIDNCLVKGKFEGKYKYLGGICGAIAYHSGNEGAIEIKNCVSEINGNVTELGSSYSLYGGIIGDIATGTVNVINCRNKGMLFKNSGGIIGNCWGGSNVTINKCVNLKFKMGLQLGGIVGNVAGSGENYYTNVTILNSANYGNLDASNNNYVGGMVGRVTTYATATINNSHVNGVVSLSDANYKGGGIVGTVNGTCNINNVYVDGTFDLTKTNWIVGSGSAICTNVYRPADDNTANDVDENGVPSGVSTYTATDLLGNMNDNIPAGGERWSNNISITMPDGSIKNVVGFAFEEQPVGPQRP